MTILMVSSGNSSNGISPIVKRQGDSLLPHGIIVDYYVIKGIGFLGYLKNFNSLRKKIKIIKPDIIHAHYSLSAYLATLIGPKCLVVSFMGSDIQVVGIKKFLLKLFITLFWRNIIVKSDGMKVKLGNIKVSIIPNGVDDTIFYPMNKTCCQEQLLWSTTKKHLLFAANPNRGEKNFALAQNAFNLLNEENLEMHSLIEVSPSMIPIWMNAADFIILTSFWEGSPNVIKEAMACCRPVVVTDVGDIKWLFGAEPGYFIANYTAEDVAEKMKLAALFSEKHLRTNGSTRIKELGLDSANTSMNLVNYYKKVLS